MKINVLSVGILLFAIGILVTGLALGQAAATAQKAYSAAKATPPPASDSSVTCPYCGCVFTNDQEDADADDEDADSDAARQVADEERMRKAGTSLGDAQSQDTEEPVDAAAALRDQLQSHLMRIVNCNGNGFWITCEHALEEAVLTRSAVKAEWVRCSDPKTCGDVLDDEKAHPGVRHVGERYTAGLDE